MSSLDQYNALYINQLRLSSPTQKKRQNVAFHCISFHPQLT